MSEKRDIQISKALSYLLRHGAIKERLAIDSAGYAKLSDVLQNNRLKTHKATLEDIQRVVENNDKKRFNIKPRDTDSELMICATQGHSLKAIANDNLELLHKDQFPEHLIHGTTKKNLELILKSRGLSKMNRNHIHFTSKLVSDSQSVSGLRNFSTILIFLDIAKIQADGIKFYKSLNDVYLSAGIDGLISTKYFSRIVDRSSGEELEIF